MPDCDQFARVVGRYGRAAVNALERTLMDGAVMDHHALAKLLENLWRTAGGVGCLESLLEAAPHPDTSIAINHVEEVATTESTLDLVAKRSVQRAVIAGQTAPEQVLAQIAQDVLLRHVVHAKGGLLDRIGADMVYSKTKLIASTLAPVTHAAASRLASNPNLMSLGISRYFEKSTSGNILHERLA